MLRPWITRVRSAGPAKAAADPALPARLAVLSASLVREVWCARADGCAQVHLWSP